MNTVSSYIDTIENRGFQQFGKEAVIVSHTGFTGMVYRVRENPVRLRSNFKILFLILANWSLLANDYKDYFILFHVTRILRYELTKEGGKVDDLVIDFAKAFDLVHRDRLMYKLSRTGIDK